MCVCVFLPLITGLISSEAETEQSVIMGILIHSATISRKHSNPILYYLFYNSFTCAYVWWFQLYFRITCMWRYFTRPLLPPPFLLLLFPVTETHKHNRSKQTIRITESVPVVYINRKQLLNALGTQTDELQMCWKNFLVSCENNYLFPVQVDLSG